jgi:hypothetical protein
MKQHTHTDPQAALQDTWLTGKTANDTTDLLPNVKEGCKITVYMTNTNLTSQCPQKVQACYRS